MVNSTLSGNSGGGIFNDGQTVSLKNTLLAHGDSGGNCGNLSGTFASLGHNLSDDPTCTSFLILTGDQNNTPAGLDSGLKNNGGPTQTIALLSTSPALGAIPVSPTNYCTLADGVTPVTTDQRGIARPQGTACDIGAFELVKGVPFASLTARLFILRFPKGSFSLDAKFTPGAASKGIDPLTQPVTLSVGPYSATIPPGSFHKFLGMYFYQGAIGGSLLGVQVAPLGGGSYAFNAAGLPIYFAGLSNPVTVAIAIGNDTGTISVNAIM